MRLLKLCYITCCGFISAKKTFDKATLKVITSIQSLEDLSTHNNKYETTFMIYYTNSAFTYSAQGPVDFKNEDDETVSKEGKSELKYFINKILEPLTNIDVQVAAIDCDKNEDTRTLCGDQGVMRYPTLKLYDRLQYPITYIPKNVEERLETSKSLPSIEKTLNWVNHNIVTEKANSGNSAVNRFVSNMSGGLLFKIIREKLKLVLFCNRADDICLSFQVNTWKLATEKGFGKLNLAKKKKLDFAYVDCGNYDEICDGFAVERDLAGKRSNPNFHASAQRIHEAHDAGSATSSGSNKPDEPNNSNSDEIIDVDLEEEAFVENDNSDEQERKNLADQEDLTIMLLSYGQEVFRTKIDRSTFRYPNLVDEIKDVIKTRLDSNYRLVKDNVFARDEL